MERYLAIMNTASVNMCVHVFDYYYVIPVSGIDE